MPTLLTVAEFSELLRIKPATARSWILKRKISYIKLSGTRSVRIPQSEAQRLLDNLIPALPRTTL
ncbi:MAG TPA: helix-turn-helix domain-containing protein [Terriglobales bacterium]|nr:helix-turn-helix domain-containing protein [Terriglobales bacterium]